MILEANKKGYVCKKCLNEFIRDIISESPLMGCVPKDGSRYGINTGSPDEWANYMTKLAGKESSYNTNTVGDVGIFEGNSNGLFQLSPNDALNYRFQDPPYTQEQLVDPDVNVRAAIRIHERLIDQDGVISEGNRGAARYWGPLRKGRSWEDET